jgi:hypothetical protein
MSWYDKVPVLGAGARAIQGDWDKAGSDLLWNTVPGVGLAHDAYNAYTGAQDELRKGYQTAIQQSREEAEKQRQFQMQGLRQAENYYLPAQQMVGAAYGSPGALRK